MLAKLFFFLAVCRLASADTCLHCICLHESGCKPIGCEMDLGSLSCGYYQIKLPYYEDCGQPGKNAGESTEDAWKRCSDDLNCSTNCVNAYYNRYKAGCASTGEGQCQVMARNHNGGPSGCKKMEELLATGTLFKAVNTGAACVCSSASIRFGLNPLFRHLPLFCRFQYTKWSSYSQIWKRCANVIYLILVKYMIILLERKATLRNNLDLTAYQREETTTHVIENILQELMNPTSPLPETEEKDEEWLVLEKNYFDEVEKLKHTMMKKETALTEGFRKANEAMSETLRTQKRLRPIDHQDMLNAEASVQQRFTDACNILRDEIASKLLVLRRDTEQAGRKRRNFDKRTTDILQSWFHEHLDRPYPNDEEKTKLAKQCGIKVSQVNNWFGNQRIRNKHQGKKSSDDLSDQPGFPKEVEFFPAMSEAEEGYSQQSQKFSQSQSSTFDNPTTSSDTIFAAFNDAINYVNN
ncbi:unnamed protein product [Caenorhabditis auriculariae]|uniref:lysozyme n=1 Tax=Caenorhabditis auriculariae TaxID=2777116 RepID=A0A8S1HAC5_9PELO|nr:unnamed protein product [Caenorhabditis auriculariae]